MRYLVRMNVASQSSFSFYWRAYATKTIKTPTLAESITEGVLGTWEKKVGAYVARDEVVANIETDKITLPVNSPEAGVIVEHCVREGDTVTVGSELFKIDTEGKASGESSKEASKASEAKRPEPKGEEKPLPAAASKTLSAKSIEEKKSPAYAKHMEEKKAPALFKESDQSSTTRHELKSKMTPMRQRISQRLKESQDTAASLTTFNEIDMSAVMEMRNQYKEEILKKHNVKFGLMSAFIKAATTALLEIPMVNSRIEGNEIITPNYIDMSVAVATPKGLVTPVLKNCQSMGLIEIEKALAELGEKARNGQLSMSDLHGGSFTISNGGIFGSLMGTPIINTPQSAILGMHAIKERPIAVDGQVVVRPMMYLALTYDHRIIDGREAVTFLVRIKSLLEDPKRFLVGL